MKNKKEKSIIICDAVCGILVMLSVLVFVILGIARDWWHPGWIIIVASVIVSVVASIVTNLVVELKKSDEETDEEQKKNRKNMLQK